MGVMQIRYCESFAFTSAAGRCRTVACPLLSRLAVLWGMTGIRATMPTNLYLNDRRTILAVDTVDGESGAPMQSPLLSPLLGGRAVREDIAEALLRRHGGRWITARGVKQYPPASVASAAVLEDMPS